MDTNSLGGGTRESCCSIRSILRGRDAFPFLPFPTRGTSTSSKRNKKWVWFRIRHTFIYACIYTTIKNNQETGQFLISHLEDILTQLCSCIFTFLFGFLWLSNIQKEQAVIRLLGQQTSEKQKDAMSTHFRLCSWKHSFPPHILLFKTTTFTIN